MSKLVLLGGPTGVGKSTTLQLLRDRLPKLSLLDADDIPLVALGPALADAGLTDALVPLAERVATAARPAT